MTRLNLLLGEVLKRPFYRSFYGEDWVNRLTENNGIPSLDELPLLPVLQKSDWVPNDPQRPARLFDLPRNCYSRLHQTSGTSGFPITVLDTPDDWIWWMDCWDRVLDSANVTRDDVAMMAFSFGPFIGFWTANDALVRRKTCVVPGGGMTSEARLRMIEQHQCTIVCCTPTYALRLAEVAKEIGFDLAGCSVSRVLVAGEPGGSLPSVRSRMEEAWGARVIDHAGGSEVGAWGFGNVEGAGLFVNETEFLAEVLVFDDEHPGGRNAATGEQGELVMTSLGRFGGPVIRYRTGDRVEPVWPPLDQNGFLFLDGGVLGRTDDMVVVRGVNVFPSSVETLVRELDGGAEFRIILNRKSELDQVTIELEGDKQLAERLSNRLRDRLAIRVEVRCVPRGTLPKFDAKARRILDKRDKR